VSPDPFAGHRTIALDIETTGLSKRSDRIVEFALIGSEADGEQIMIERFVDPGRPIPREAVRVHGISDEEVSGAGSFAEHAEEIAGITDGAVLVGHNIVNFDWPFLRHEFARAGLPPPAPRAIIDTLQLARRLKVPGRHTLGALADGHGIDLENAHRAAADAGACLLLLYIWSKQRPREFGGSLDDLESWIRNPNRRDSELGPGLIDLEPLPRTAGRIRLSDDEFVLDFGKHRTRTLREVQLSDPSYIGWLLSRNGPFTDPVNEILREHLD